MATEESAAPTSVTRPFFTRGPRTVCAQPDGLLRNPRAHDGTASPRWNVADISDDNAALANLNLTALDSAAALVERRRGSWTTKGNTRRRRDDATTRRRDNATT